MDLFNRPSAWIYLNDYQVLGYAVDVPDVTGFAIQVNDRVTTLSWDLISDYPVGYYQIRYSSDTVSPTWNESLTIVDNISSSTGFVQVASIAGSYLIKAYSRGGIGQSVNAALVENNSTTILDLNVVDTIQEDPTFTGAKTNVVYDSTLGGIHLSTTTDGSGFVHTPTEGFYYFHLKEDLGAVYTSRITPTVEGYAVSLNNNVDFWTDVDAIPNWDGGTLPDWSMIGEIRLTNDDPASGTATWTAWQRFKTGDYTARGYDFRAHLYAPEDGASPVITKLSVLIDMPDRVTGGQNIVCPTGGVRVDITPPYKSLKATAIDIQNAVAGDYYVMSSRDETGFNIRFYNSTGTAVSRTFDWVAKGYGVKVP